MKKDSPIGSYIYLRATVGFLGQSAKWWNCQFLSPTGPRMLQTIFPRTSHQAAIRSVMQAATLHHDKVLGKRGVYHLFRLPSSVEDRVASAMNELDNSSWAELVVTHQETALNMLKKMVASTIQVNPGPVQVGTIGRLVNRQSVEELALHYHAAFTQSVECIPYFGAKLNVR